MSTAKSSSDAFSAMTPLQSVTKVYKDIAGIAVVGITLGLSGPAHLQGRLEFA